MNGNRTNLWHLRLFACALLLLWAGVVHSQSIENVRAEFSNKSVVITYDLNGTPEQRFNIAIYGSHNNYGAPLRLVTGAVGDGQVAGKSKVIEWRIGEELVTFTGQIVFRLKGELMAGPLRLQSPVANSAVKLGKQKEIKWTGGKPTQSVRIELLQGGAVVRSITEGSNTGSFAWSVPKDLEKGTYDLRITSGSESPQTVSIQLKAGLPLWAKLAPIAVVGAVVAVIFLLPDGETPPPEGDLPDAPNPVD